MASAPLCPCPNCGCHFDRRREDLGTVPPHSNRLSELILSNQIPLEVECQQIEPLCAAAHARSAELEQQITRLRASLDSLLELQKKQQDAVEQYKMVVGPVRRVPEEIWQEIFEESTVLELLPRYLADDIACIPSSFRYGGTPWTLSQVSTKWRQISINHRVLWSTIIFDAIDIEDAQVWPQLLVQISRTGNHPLRICVDATYGGCYEVEMSNPVISLLLSTSSRWQELFMVADCGWLSLFDRFPSVFTQLRMVCFTSFKVPFPTTPFHFLRSAPSLTHLVTIGPFQFHHMALPPLHLQKWTSFWPQRISNQSTQTAPLDTACALDMLDIMSSLQTVDIFFSFHNQVGVPESRVVIHPSLTSLTTTGNSMLALKHLKIPTLSSLMLTAGPICCDSVVGLIDRCGCSLVELSLLALRPWPQQVDEFQVSLRRVLERVPNLLCLVIGYTNAISWTGGGPSSEAHLQQITELCCAAQTDATPSLVSALEILDLRFTTLLPDDLSQQIQSMRPSLTLRESKCFPPFYS